MPRLLQIADLDHLALVRGVGEMAQAFSNSLQFDILSAVGPMVDSAALSEDVCAELNK